MAPLLLLLVTTGFRWILFGKYWCISTLKA